MVALVILRQTGLRVNQNISLCVPLEVRAYNRTKVLAYLSGYLNVEPRCFFQFKHIRFAIQFFYLVAVFGEVQINVPGKIACLNRSCAKGNLNTFVFYLAGINQAIVITGCPGTCHSHNLVFTDLRIVGEIQSDTVLQEFQFQSHFHGVCFGWFQVFVGDGSVIDISDGISGISIFGFRIDESQLIRIGIATYLRP